MTHIVVATDNVTLRLDSDDASVSTYLQAVASILNDHMEIRRDAIAQAMSDLMCYGRCEWPIP